MYMKYLFAYLLVSCFIILYDGLIFGKCVFYINRKGKHAHLLNLN